MGCFAQTACAIATGFVFSATCQAQTSGGTQPAPSTPVKGGVFVPTPISPVPSTILGSIQYAQAPTLNAIFCGDLNNSLLILELSDSPTEFSPVQYNEGEDTAATWTTYISNSYNWIDIFSDGDIDADQFTTLFSENITADLLVGSLDASCGSATMVAISMSWKNDQNIRQYALIPVFEVPQSVYDTLDTFLEQSPLGIIESTIIVDCDVCEPMCCYDRYSQRVADALLDYTGEIKSNVPPLGGAALGCIALCAKWGWGSPAAIAACTTACGTGVVIAGVINANTASSYLDHRIETAKQSFCLCREYQDTHCPSTDPDFVGCGD